MKRELPAYAVLPPCPVTVVCTYDADEKPNGLAVSWTGIAVSEPPHVADYFGITSGRKTNKFEDLDLTPMPAEHVHAPMIAEFPLSLECRVVSRQEIGSHSVFIAEILAVHVDERILDAEGKIDVVLLRPLAYDHAKYLYLAQGQVLGRAFSAGKILKKS